MEQSLRVGRDGGRSRWQEEAVWPCLSMEDEETPGGVKQREEQDILFILGDWVVCVFRFE